MKTKAIYIGENADFCKKITIESQNVEVIHTQQVAPALLRNNDIGLVLLEESNDNDKLLNNIKLIKEQIDGTATVLFVLCNKLGSQDYLKLGADDVFTFDTPIVNIDKRFQFFQKYRAQLKQNRREHIPLYRIPIWKRTFDILFSGFALLCLSPFFLIIAILIRLESKGKVFYGDKRVGMGYKIFSFYKFRSMYVDADKRVDALMQKKQYSGDESNENKLVQEPENQHNTTILLSDDEMISEPDYLKKKQKKQELAFFKMTNDPRITKVGRFIRNTSIDELPQLVNIFIGDMSVVGNRPLPLYEAELLTTVVPTK